MNYNIAVDMSKIEKILTDLCTEVIKNKMKMNGYRLAMKSNQIFLLWEGHIDHKKLEFKFRYYKGVHVFITYLGIEDHIDITDNELMGLLVDQNGYVNRNDYVSQVKRKIDIAFGVITHRLKQRGEDD